MKKEKANCIWNKEAKTVDIVHTHTHGWNLKENSKVITLIALVVTIIAMTVLSGTAINLVAGSGGLIEKARYAHYCEEFEKVKAAFELYAANKKIELYGSSNVENTYEVADMEKIITPTADGGYDVT